MSNKITADYLNSRRSAVAKRIKSITPDIKTGQLDPIRAVALQRNNSDTPVRTNPDRYASSEIRTNPDTSELRSRWDKEDREKSAKNTHPIPERTSIVTINNKTYNSVPKKEVTVQNNYGVPVLGYAAASQRNGSSNNQESIYSADQGATAKKGAEQAQERRKNQTLVKNVNDKQEVSTAMSKWLSDGYKMTTDEKKQAKQLYSQYENNQKSQIKAGNYQSTTNPSVDDLNMIRLKNKINASALPGFIGSAKPLLDLQGKAMQSISHDNKYVKSQVDALNNYMSDSKTQNPGAYFMGNMAGQAAQYASLNGMLEGTKVADTLGKLGQVAASKLPLLGDTAKGVVGNSIGNVLNGQLADTVLSTVPEITDNALNGKYSNGNGNVMADIAKNQASNLAYNALFEAPTLLKGLKNASPAVNTSTLPAENIPVSGNTLENSVQNEAKNVQTQNVPSNIEETKLPKNINGNNVTENIPAVSTAKNVSEPVSTKSVNQYSQNAVTAKQKLQYIVNSIDSRTPSTVKQQIKSKANEIYNTIDLIGNATDSDAIQQNMKNLETQVNELRKFAEDNKVKLYGGYDNTAKQAFQQNIKEPTDGLVINIPKKVLKELDIKDAKTASKLIFTGKNGKSIRFGANVGSNLSSTFNELDGRLKGALSNYMNEQGLSLGNEADQFRGLIGYINSNRKLSGNKKIISDLFGQSIEDSVGYNLLNPKTLVKDAETSNIPVQHQNLIDTQPKVTEKAAKTARKNAQFTIDEETLNKQINKVPDNDPRTTEEIWNELTSGNIKKETALEDLNPLASEPGKKISRVRSNTMQNSGQATEEELVSDYGKKLYEYVPDNEKENLIEAKNRVTSDPEKWMQHYSDEKINDANLTGKDADTMMQLWSTYNKQAREARDNGNMDLANQLKNKAIAISSIMQKKGTSGGQFNAAFAKYTHTADGAVQKGYEVLQKNADDFAKNNPKAASGIDELAQKLSIILKNKNAENVIANGTEAQKNALRADLNEALDKMLNKSDRETRKALKGLSQDAINDILSARQKSDIERTLDYFASSGSVGVKDETMDRVVELFDEADKYNFNSKNRVRIEEKAYSMIANDIAQGKSFKDKFDEWRYFSMLSNPVTHIKNINGNILFGSGSVSAKNSIASLIESSADRVSKAMGGNGIERTKSLLTPSDKDLVQLCKNDAYENAYRELSGNKYYNIRSSIENAIPTWSNKNAVGRMLNKATSFNTRLLNKEDELAVITKYQTSLAGYLKANGYGKNIFSSKDKKAKDVLDNARSYAIQQAKEAAFHQDSELAHNITQFTSNLRSSEKLHNRVFGSAIDVVVPFKKTPINILKSAVAYSPAEFVKVGSEIPGLMKGSIKPAKFIDDISKGITGSTGLLIGAILAHEGIITSGYTESDKAQKFDKTTGKGQTAIHIGNHSLAINELSPAASPLIYGAVAYETLANKMGSTSAIDTAINGLTSTANSITDMTMLSGIADTLSSVRYAEADSDIFKALGMNALGNTASQMVPTVGGRIQKSIDDTARSSYSDKSGIAKQIDQQAKYLSTKLPGMQQLGGALSGSKNSSVSEAGKSINLQPAIDAWGREKKNVGGNTAGRFAYNMLSPLQYSADTSDKNDNALRTLYKKTGNDTIFPYTSSKDASVQVNGKTVNMTPEQWTDYQKKKGSLSRELVSAFTSGSDYSKLKDADKIDIIGNLYKFSQNLNQHDIAGSELSSSSETMSDIYKKDGSSGVIKYLTENAIINDTGAKANDKTREIYEKSGLSGLMKYQKKSDAISSAGLTMSDKTESIYDKSGTSGIKKYAEKKKLADKYGLEVGDNTDSVYNKYGNKGLKDYKTFKNVSGHTSSDAVGFLKKQNYSDEEKGFLLAQKYKNNDKVKELSSSGKYEDIYKTYLYKSEADTNLNGSASKKEIQTFLDSQNLSQSQKRYYFGLMSSAKNPY